MSYAKSLKKSPFKTISITLGKMPDGSIWQTAFITQDGGLPSASFTCHSDATAAERKGFLPLVKKAMPRAQSMEELIDLLKSPALTPMPDVPSFKTGEENEQGATRAADTMAQQGSLKVQLLYLLMKHGDPDAAIQAVLNSTWLPKPQRQQFLVRIMERTIHRCKGRRDCASWERWATRWLEAADRTAQAAREIADATARAAMWDLSWCAEAAVSLKTDDAYSVKWYAERVAAPCSGAEECKAQYDDLLNLINEL